MNIPRGLIEREEGTDRRDLHGLVVAVVDESKDRSIRVIGKKASSVADDRKEVSADK